MFERILVLCTGNICRSPMAEALLRHRLEQTRRVAEVRSAGLGALVGLPAEAPAQTLMARRGLDIGGHRATQVNRELVRWADLVLVMDAPQRWRLMDIDMAASGKTYLLGHWTDTEIPDPYMQDLAAFERSLDLIEQGIAEWLRRL